MKKRIILLFALLLVLTGCRDKVLNCTLEETLNDENYKETVRITFNRAGDEVLRREHTMTLTGGEFINEYYEEMTMQCDEQKSFAGVTCDVTKDGNSLTMSRTIVYSELNTQSREMFGLLGSIDDFKHDMELDGFTCK